MSEDVRDMMLEDSKDLLDNVEVTTVADVSPEFVGVVAVIQHPPRGQPITGWARSRRR